MTRKGRLNSQDFDLIINLMHKVDASIRDPSDCLSPVMFLRGMAYQQFWHQETHTRSHISRQAILFRHLDQSHRFRRLFIERTGISIDNWIDISFMLLAAFLPGNRDWIAASYFDPAINAFSSGKITKFLDSVSKDVMGLRQYLGRLEGRRTTDSSEFREQSPLVRFPLIRLDDKYHYYSISLLTKSLGNYIYEILRAEDVQQFMDIFGPLFERYVKRGMDYLGEPYLTESDIARRSYGSRVVDFAILEQDTNILIDAKGVEMTHGGMTSHRAEVITGQLKSSILSGIQQGIKTAQALGKHDPARWHRNKNFLVVVTFEELYLGTGADFSRYVVAERLRKSLGGAVGESIIPLEHMYFLSVDEFDYLVHALKANNVSLGVFLREISVEDQRPQTKCLLVAQHILRRWPAPSAPAYIDTEFEALFERAARALGVNRRNDGV